MEKVLEAVASGHISGKGMFSLQIQKFLAEMLGVEYALLTTSSATALWMAVLLIDLREGDEVIIPSFASACIGNAVCRAFGTPVIVDVSKDSLNIDPASIETKISKRTKGIIVNHYAGIGADMDSVLDISSRYGLTVVEDCCQALFGSINEAPLGTFGRMASLDFHETCAVTMGEGGALLLNDESLIDRADIIHEKGTNRSKFFRGQVDKYTWVDHGSSCVPSELLAAVLAAQLEHLDEIRSARKRIWESYNTGLAVWARDKGVQLPFVPKGRTPSYAGYFILVPEKGLRDHVINHLKACEILSVFHYVPLHLSPMGQELGCKPGDCPVSEDTFERLIRLPFYKDLTNEEQERVIEAVCSSF